MQTSTFYHLGKDLRELAGELCGGRIAFFLEGGYEEASLGDSVANTFRGILDMVHGPTNTSKPLKLLHSSQATLILLLSPAVAVCRR